MLDPLIKNAPVIGSCYGFATTAIKVYNTTTPAGAIKTAAKGVLIDCTPPAIKYPVLCATLIACGVASFVTGGNPLVVSATVTIGEAIVESAL